LTPDNRGFEGGFLPLLNLHASKIRISFTAEKPRRIYGIETALRGRLGFHFKRVRCPYPDFRKRPCDGCELIENCLYLTIFAPEPPSTVQNGASRPMRRRHPTRPYVVEADGPDNRRVLGKIG
jgi:hypothetical protein